MFDRGRVTAHIENGFIMKRLGKKISPGIVLSGLAIVISIGAWFQTRESNKILRLSLPSIEILKIENHPIKGYLPDGYHVTICRTELRIANTGGSGTSIIGLKTIGEFDRGGYLPEFGQRLVELELSRYRGGPRLLNFPIPTGIAFKDTFFKGPIPYQVAITKKEGDSPLLDNSAVERKAAQTDMYDLSDMLRQLRGQSKIGTLLSSQVMSEDAIIQTEPFGLPLYIPENSVQDVNIDFRYAMPKEFDLLDFSVQRRMAREGIDPRVGYRLDFPGSPSIKVQPLRCKGIITTTK